MEERIPNNLQPDKSREMSLETLYDSYYRMLALFAHQIVEDIDAAQDIVQEIFIRFWKDGKRTDPQFNYEAYLFQSVKYAAMNYLRDGRRHQKVHKEIGLNRPTAEDSPHLTEVEDFEIIYKTINQLPPERKKIFEMVYIDGMKYQEVADRLGISFHTVKSQISKALVFLREKLSSRQHLILIHLLI